MSVFSSARRTFYDILRREYLTAAPESPTLQLLLLDILSPAMSQLFLRCWSPPDRLEQLPIKKYTAPRTWTSVAGQIWGNSHFLVQLSPFPPHTSTTEGGGTVSLYWGVENKGTTTQKEKDLELSSSHICSHGPGEKPPLNSSQSSHCGYSQISAFLLDPTGLSSWPLSTTA